MYVGSMSHFQLDLNEQIICGVKVTIHLKKRAIQVATLMSSDKNNKN